MTTTTVGDRCADYAASTRNRHTLGCTCLTCDGERQFAHRMMATGRDLCVQCNTWQIVTKDNLVRRHKRSTPGRWNMVACEGSALPGFRTLNGEAVRGPR